MAPKRFHLTYRNAAGEEEHCLVIHRAPLGTHERFVAFLLEHYGGAFPVWLAPVQVMIIPIAERHYAYAQTCRTRLFNCEVPNACGGIRVEVDTSTERMQKKIRNAQMLKIPYMLVVGDQEAESETVSVRQRDGKNLGSIPLSEFCESIQQAIRSRDATIQ